MVDELNLEFHTHGIFHKKKDLSKYKCGHPRTTENTYARFDKNRGFITKMCKTCKYAKHKLYKKSKMKPKQSKKFLRMDVTDFTLEQISYLQTMHAIFKGESK